MPLRHPTLLVCLLLSFITLAVFAPVRNHEFVNYDDPSYVTENTLVQGGITREGIRKILTEPHVGFYHPLTLFSHMLDCELFGLNPGPHHLVNLGFHAASALLLFLALRGMTGALWRSAFVAALFALHPLRVESVAWVAERKDVLSTFFWMLTLLAYGRYVRRASVSRYAWLLTPFLLGLLAKPMLVTLPFVLLLLDYWPLGRMVLRREPPWIALAAKGSGTPDPAGALKSTLPLFLEKIPLMALSAAASVLAWHAQVQVNALVSSDILAFHARLGNALTSYVAYLWKTVWPAGLAVHYPYDGAPASWKAMGAALLLVLLTVMALRCLREKPYVPVGWLWYLGTLVPVIGLAQLGDQAMADRYTYIPSIGLFLVIVWGLVDSLIPYRHGKMVLAGCAALGLGILTALTIGQLGHWKNTVTLFEHAIRVTRDNAKAHKNLGVALAGQGRIKEAEEHYRKALLIAPNSVDAHNNLGLSLAKRGRHEEAMVAYHRAIDLNPRYAKAYNNLGLSLAHQGRMAEAIEHFQKTLQLDPHSVDAMNNLGRAFQGLGDPDRAIEQYRKALALSPKHPMVLTNLGTCLFQKGSPLEAEETLRHAIRLDPRLASAYNALATLHATSGRFEEAVKTRRQALSIEPDNGAAHYHMAVECFFSGDPVGAIKHCDRAVELGYEGVEGAFLEELRPLRKLGNRGLVAGPPLP